MGWRVEASTLLGVKQGEIEDCKAARCTEVMRAIRSGSFTVNLSNPAAEFLLAGDALIRMYDETGVLKFHGELLTAQEVADEKGGSVAVTAADPFVRLTQRLLGKTTVGYTRGTALSPVDKLVLVQEFIDTVNAEGDTGIDTSLLASAIAAGARSYSTYVGVPVPWYFKIVANAISELSGTLDGFDWTMEPIEYASGKIGQIRAASQFGSTNNDAAFEYGDGKLNVRSYTRPVTNQDLLNIGYNLPPSFPDNATQAVLGGLVANATADADSIALRGRREGIVPGDLIVDELRLKLVQAHVRIRRQARRTITFEPVQNISGNVPIMGRQFVLGDAVPFRATVVINDVPRKRIDLKARVYGAEYVVHDVTKLATPTYTLVPQ